MESLAVKSHLVEGRRIRLRGLVQGVGFRPAVWRLARDHGLDGEVLNDGAGVLIHAWGRAEDLERFIVALGEQAPPLARIDALECQPIAAPPEARGFHIAASVSDGARTGIVPDACTCNACRAEIADPTNRRHRYPFTNCTHCGPRLSIVNAIPYDRANTAMAAFRMCPACLREYDDPADRRFHAQPNACPACGPRAWLENAAGNVVDTSGHRDAADAAADFIRQGRIVAVKGIGGFHLACDAGSDEAVTELRRRKRRYGKPFALMARDVAMVEGYVASTADERAALESAAAPIVVMARCWDVTLPEDLAPGQDTLGFMLPYSPLHHILMADMTRPIVLTSGNRSDEPQTIDNAEAREALAGIADFWLMHDRDIVNREDDSVVRLMDGEIRVVRRARGFAPAPMPLPDGFENAPTVLALGAELKNTFCLLKDGAAIVSQHMGDQENPAAHADARTNIDFYLRLNRTEPAVVAIDMHPDYIPTAWGRTLAVKYDCPLASVQHHHAHVAAVMAEHGLARNHGPVLGVVLDGLGFGPGGNLWGGEFLIADYADFDRVRHFEPVPLIGGAKAMVEPWRNTLAHLELAIGWSEVERRFGGLDAVRRMREKPVSLCLTMLARGVNVPPASSAGRLFDAAAAALGICFDAVGYEGEAAIRLEALARQGSEDTGRYPVDADDPLQWRGLWDGLLQDLADGNAPETIARRFHETLIHAICRAARSVANGARLDCIVLSGGVFQNRILLEGVADELRAEGFRVLLPRQFPGNDGGLSLGQAMVAAAHHLKGEQR